LVLNNDMKKLYQTGFTVIELMIVVAMMGILMAVGVPVFNSIILTNEMADTSNELVLSLKRARAEAMTSGRDVVVCSSTNTDAATPACSGAAGNWGRGWIVFVDQNQDRTFDEANGDRLVWLKKMDDGTSISITPSPFGTLTNDFSVAVTFSHTGELKDGTAGGFQICSGDADGYPRRDISIMVGGEANLVKNTNTANDC
jgi:type IV fimbrial biogenesis protein FimT